MYQIARNENPAESYTLVVGPLISAGDALTPYVNFDDLPTSGVEVGVIDSTTNLSDVKTGITITSLTKGYYVLSIPVSGSWGYTFTANGSSKLLIQATSEILAYNMDIMVLHPDTYDELINGPAISNSEITQILQQVSGSTNISTQLSATQTQITSLGSTLTPIVTNTDSNVGTLLNTDVPAVKVDTSLILSKITKVGSISADIISGGILKKAGTTIKDIEVRDNRVYVSYRDPADGQMKVYDQLFTQDVIIASGGDLSI